MQDQTAAPQSPQKSARRLSSKWLILLIVIISVLIVVTGIFYLQTGATSSYTLLGTLFTLITVIFTFVQIILAIFPPRSDQNQTVIHSQTTYVNTHPVHGVSNLPTPHPHIPVIPTTPQPIFRPNMHLKDPDELHAREKERIKLRSRTINGAPTSIVGERRMGKTWLMEYLQLIAPTDPQLGPRFRVGLLSATHPECKTLSGFTVRALRELKIPHLPPPSKANLEY